MKAIENDRLYFWHVLFEITGCNKGITVLDIMFLIRSISNATFSLPWKYPILERTENNLYWLSDGICPKTPCFLHSIANQSMEDKFPYEIRQEGRRKNFKKSLEFFNFKLHITDLLSSLWRESNMTKVFYCCVIFHSMAVMENVR